MQAQLVIIGAGIVGCSTAYHLAQMGQKDIVVLDQGPLFETGGSTSHAPGGVFQTNYSKMMTDLARYTVQLYSELTLDGLPCFHSVGSLEVAHTRERLEDLKRKLGVAKSWGLESELITPEQARDKLPLLDPKVIHGAYFVASDGIAKAVRASEVMSRGATKQGVTFYGNTSVTGIDVRAGRVRAVQTDTGPIATEKVLVCAGIWGPRIGRMVGVSIPLTPVEHQYVRTVPLPELAGETREVVHPVLRHQDAAMYFRQHADGYGIGSYNHEPLLVDPDAILSHADASVMPSLRTFTPEHFKAAHDAAIQLLPALRNADFTDRINGMFSFTPDGFPLLGESPEVRGFWVAEAVWITHGGGVGKAMAEWMVEGAPDIDLREADFNRFPAHAHTPTYVRIRGAQQYREVYDIIHPLQQMENPRPLRLSPFHPRLQEQGGVFFENAGWERPQWFEANKNLPTDPGWPLRSGWAAQHWSPIQGTEHRATREHVALFDLTPFTKIQINGPGALAFLQRLTARQMDRPVGNVIYTSMLNAKGGIVSDLTITRQNADTFFLVTGASTGPHDLAWIQNHMPTDGSVRMTDLTSGMCTLGLWGPKTRRVLQQVCDNDVSNRAFPFFTAQHISIGPIPVLALRVSYVGELGWELYAPTEYGLRLWDTLWEAGESSGIFALGGGAFDSLRLEKGYRLWGADIHTEYTPYEAGLGWAVALDKGDFLGRDALLKVQNPTRTLCCLTLDDPEAIVLGKEPILEGDRALGYVTSTNYGYTIDKHIVYGYLPIEYAQEGTRVCVEYFGNPHSATVVREPLYDPSHKKLKS